MKKKLIALLLTIALIFALSPNYLEAKSKVASVKTFKATNVTTESVTLSWKKVSKASGYQIQLKMDGESFFPEKTIKKASKTTYKCKELYAGEKYIFRIRAYKKAGKKKIYSAWKKVTVTTKSDDSSTDNSTRVVDTPTPDTNTYNNTPTNTVPDTSYDTTPSNTNTDTNTGSDTTVQQPTSSTVYTTATGKKYHSTKSCKGLNNARNIYEKNESDAINSGLTKCDLCY